MKTAALLMLSVILTSGITSTLAAEPVQLSFQETTLTANLQMSDGKSLADGIILITHGTLGHSKMDIIQSLQGNLDTAGYSTLAINLALGAPDREFMYDCKNPHNHRHHDAMEEIAAWVSWLTGKGATAITVIGHSRGGNQTAWYAAGQSPGIVNKVVLITPATWNEMASRRAYQKRYGVALGQVIQKAKSLSEEQSDDAVLSSTGFLYCPDADVTAGSFLSYYSVDNRRNTPFLLPDLRQQTLVIAGSDDTVVGDLPDQIQGMDLPDHIRFEVVDGAGHFFRDLYGEDLSDLIVEFLEAEE
jgi:pimeloyl-ACP methyl ester carboxylesterase